MSDEKQEITETAAVDNTGRDKPESLNVVESARSEREKLESLTKEAQELRKQLSELKAQEILSGESGGAVKRETKKELTPKEYADLVMSGNTPNE